MSCRQWFSWDLTTKQQNCKRFLIHDLIIDIIFSNMMMIIQYHVFTVNCMCTGAGAYMHEQPYNSERSEVSTRTRTKKYGFTHIPRVLVKCCSCSPYRVAFHRQLSDCQTWISIFTRTQSGYKPADLLDFTNLVQKFASALYLRPSSR